MNDNVNITVTSDHHKKDRTSGEKRIRFSFL